MKYIVFDLEFNQPAAKDKIIFEPIVFCAEIIQIGAVKMDENFKITDTLDIIVEPIYYTETSNRVHRTIRLNHAEDSNALPFSLACKKFFDFCGEDFGLFSWSTSDIDILKKNMTIHQISLDHFSNCYDIQNAFFQQVAGSKKQTGLQEAVKMIGETQYKAHNALNDAWCAAKILAHLSLSEIKINKTSNVIASQKIIKKPFFNDFFHSMSDAIEKINSCKITCYCGKQIPIDGLFILSKRKALAISTCCCGIEYLIVAVFNKCANKNTEVKCYKEHMSVELKEFYLKQKSIDDAIKNYSAKYKSRNKKIT